MKKKNELEFVIDAKNRATADRMAATILKDNPNVLGYDCVCIGETEPERTQLSLTSDDLLNQYNEIEIDNPIIDNYKNLFYTLNDICKTVETEGVAYLSRDNSFDSDLLKAIQNSVSFKMTQNQFAQYINSLNDSEIGYVEFTNDADDIKLLNHMRDLLETQFEIEMQLELETEAMLDGFEQEDDIER